MDADPEADYPLSGNCFDIAKQKGWITVADVLPCDRLYGKGYTVAEYCATSPTATQCSKDPALCWQDTNGAKCNPSGAAWSTKSMYCSLQSDTATDP
jgi:hypothetical protein